MRELYLIMVVLGYAIWMGKLVCEYQNHSLTERHKLQTVPLMFAVTVRFCALLLLWVRIGVWCGR